MLPRQAFLFAARPRDRRRHASGAGGERGRPADPLHRRGGGLRDAAGPARRVGGEAARQRRRRHGGPRRPPRRRRSRPASRGDCNPAHPAARLCRDDLARLGQHDPDADRMGLRCGRHLHRSRRPPVRFVACRQHRRQLVRGGLRREHRSRHGPARARRSACRPSTRAGCGMPPIPTLARRSKASWSRVSRRCAAASWT